MTFPSPIVPVYRGPVAGSREAAARVALASGASTAAINPDEGLLEGSLRRARAFAADLRSPDQRMPWIAVMALSGLLMYSYWPGLMNARSSWDNPQYQHGWIVPVFALLMLFWWRMPVTQVTASARAAGVGLLVASFVARLWCANFRIVTLDMYTFVPALMGVFLLAGGWGMFRWSWAPIATLIFMYPLPDEATRYLLGPLQTLATILSTYSLQTIGLDAYRDGNRIILGDGQVLGVVDACSGLKMLTIFIWLAVMLMLVGGLEWWENVVIAASAIPIALVCNAFRITIVGVMYNFNSSLAEGFHDSLPAALLMMVMAVGFLVLEMKVLSYLVVTEDTSPMAMSGTGPARAVTSPAGPPSTVSVFPVIPGAGSEQKRPNRPPPEAGGKMG
ncbi:MAG: exosortase/archaeosortase family protein [Planctomycetota bacterium]